MSIPKDDNGVISVPDKFELHEIPGTNIFIIIKYTAYSGGTICDCGSNIVSLLFYLIICLKTKTMHTLQDTHGIERVEGAFMWKNE